MAYRSAGRLPGWPRTCPSVLRLTYYREDRRHEVLLSFDLQGNRKVALRISEAKTQTRNNRGDRGRPRWTESSWSDWHGSWCLTDTGGVLITMHFTGDADMAWPHYFEWVKPRVYQFQQWGNRCNRSLLQATADMVTELLMPAQLANTTTELEVRFEDWTPV